MDLQESTGGGVEDIDVQSLINEAYAPTQETQAPVEGQQSPDAQKPEPPAQPQPQAPNLKQEYEYDWSGKKIKEPLEMILKRAGMGYDYAQKMEALKNNQKTLEQQLRQQFEQQYKPYERYKTIDDYVKKDPQWWQHVEKSYQERLATQDPNAVRLQSILEERLKPFEQLIAERDQKALEERHAKEDADLDTSIKSIREKYPDIDFDTPDAEGKTLEYKILKHGDENGFRSFQAAFRDFYHDQLEARAEARAREAISKESQKRQKLGLSGTPQTPRQKQSDGYDVRGKSWNQIYQEVLQKENITS